MAESHPLFPLQLQKEREREVVDITPPCQSFSNFPTLLFGFAFSESKRYAYYLLEENRAAWWVLLERESLDVVLMGEIRDKMGEKDDGLGLGLGLGLGFGFGLGLGYDGSRSSVEVSPMHNSSQLVQKHQGSWNEMYQLPANQRGTCEVAHWGEENQREEVAKCLGISGGKLGCKPERNLFKSNTIQLNNSSI